MAFPLFAPRRPQPAGGPADADAAAGRAGPALKTSSARRMVHSYAREAAALLLLASALYTALALASFQGDPLRPEVNGGDWVGPVGAMYARFAVESIGLAAWLFPIELAVLAAPLLNGKPSVFGVYRCAGDIVVVMILAALAHVAFPNAVAFGAMPLGGDVGDLFGELMRTLFSTIGSYIIGLTIVGLILIGRAAFSFIEWVKKLERAAIRAAERLSRWASALGSAWTTAREIDRQKGEEARKAEGPKIAQPSGSDAIIAALTLDDDAGEGARASRVSIAMASEPELPLLPKEMLAGPVIALAAKDAAPIAITAPAPDAPANADAAAPPKPRRGKRAAAPPPEPRVITHIDVPQRAPSLDLPEAIVAGDGDDEIDAPKPPSARAFAIAPMKALEPASPKALEIASPKALEIASPKASESASPKGIEVAPKAFEIVLPKEIAIASPQPIDADAEAESDAFEDEDVSTPSPIMPIAPTPAPIAAAARSTASVAAAAPSAAPVAAASIAASARAAAPSAAAAPIAASARAAAPAAAAPNAASAPVAAPLLDPAPVADPAPAETPSAAPPVTLKIVDTTAAQVTVKAAPVRVVPAIGQGFRLPKLDMLDPPSGEQMKIDEEQLKQMAQLLEKTLSDYGVSGRVEEIHPGPTVTTFEVSPAAGTKVSKVAGLADDLALGLSRKVRIIAPIPGKNRIGFEIPNTERMPVNLRELVEDRRFQEMKAPLPCVMGRDIIGTPYFADLASMPHVIVAGATGAGKSVGLNVMLVSLLFRRTPAELRLLMIDPKVVELAPFDRIPHMLLPVVTDMKQAANALKWAVDEMERRYQLFANAGTKNITTYNGWVERVQRGEARPPKPTKVAAVAADGTEVEVDAAKDGTDVELPEKLPFIVIVVDEFADLMMQQGKDVEASVARLAQKARAAGMHVILATQRPSVDVITGMIKANFPTRVAFRVAQKVDSRTILDEQGAEHLLGRGDMLVKMNGANDTRRVQCPFCSEEEVQRITDFLRLQGEPVYDEAILKPRDEEGEEVDTSDAESDAMYDAAVRIVAETRRCSTSWIQRKLGVGYNRAAKIVEAMEKRGLVGPANGAKDREVLISPI